MDEQRPLAAEAEHREHVHLTLTEPVKPNQIVGERFTISGIAVQLIRAENPLQLINPVAPDEYFSGADNVTHEPRTGIIDGLKILSFKF